MAKLKKSEAVTAEREKEIQQASEISLCTIIKISFTLTFSYFLIWLKLFFFSTLSKYACVGCGICKWACSDYEGFVSTRDRPRYHCWQNRPQHSKCCNHCGGGSKTAAQGPLFLSHFSFYWSFFLASECVVLYSNVILCALCLQAERTQKKGGMVMCATTLIIMCFVMLVLLILKEIFL